MVLDAKAASSRWTPSGFVRSRSPSYATSRRRPPPTRRDAGSRMGSGSSLPPPWHIAKCRDWQRESRLCRIPAWFWRARGRAAAVVLWDASCVARKQRGSAATVAAAGREEEEGRGKRGLEEESHRQEELGREAPFPPFSSHFCFFFISSQG